MVEVERNNRLLIVDDNPSIHDDFRKVLGSQVDEAEIEAAETALFGLKPARMPEFTLSMASQGEEAIELTRAAMAAGKPFAVAFLDIRMPPGIDGIETARRLWELDPELQIVICSAYSDYSWGDMAAKLGAAQRWVLLKKPFENIEVLQLATSLTEKRALQAIANTRQADLERAVAERTENLRQALARLEQEATERARAEEERRALERKLEQAQRLESLGVLAGGVAHDFNNILAGILGRASLAQSAIEGNPELEEHLRAIDLCARRAAELCEQMLAYAGQGSAAVREIDVNQLVQEMRGLVEAAVPRDVEFRIELASLKPVVRGDPARLRQVVMNLLINGAEALQADERRLCLTTRVERLTAPQIERLIFSEGAKPDEFAVIEVTDTGSGMTPETIQRIFEPFFTTKFEGRGLGLCAVHGIVRSHGGALDVTSRPGVGSTFRVYLPLTIPAASATAPGLIPAGEPAFVSTTGDARLLIVDDEECVRLVVAETLRRRGYVISEANDGAAAFERFRADPDAFDAVVLDMTMPRMNGASTLEAMRQLRPRLPAVLISGHGPQGSLDHLGDSDVTAALQKPFNIERLYTTVATVLQAARASASVRE